MILIPIKTRLINPKEDILNIIIDSMNENNVSFKENDILVLAESAVATSQGRLVKLSQITPSEEALNLGKKFQMDPRLTELILKEADMIIGGVPHVLLTFKDGVFQANAGVDKSNAPEGYVTLLPENPSKTAQEYRKRILNRFNVKIGVIIADSRTQPLRLGNVGLALGVAGFEPVIDERGRKDLFKRPLRVTRRAVADNLASAAEVLMGESDESIPAVLIRDVPVKFTDREIKSSELLIPPYECLYISVFKEKLGL